jgi:short-subunit dehydrogenase
MNNKKLLASRYGEWACVLGSAEGLGFSFAWSLAGRGMNLLLVDNHKDRLAWAAGELRTRFGITCKEIILDLNTTASSSTVLDELKTVSCRLLVYNAAFGPVRTFSTNTADDLDRYIDVNIRTMLHIVHGFINRNSGRKSGILFMSSLAGFVGSRYIAPYSATKAFTWNLAEGLYYEYCGTPLDISICVPGATATPGYLATSPVHGPGVPKAMDPRAVAEIAVRQLGKKLFIIPGWQNRFSHFLLSRLLPRRLAGSIMAGAMKKLYPDIT